MVSFRLLSMSPVLLVDPALLWHGTNIILISWQQDLRNPVGEACMQIGSKESIKSIAQNQHL
jgi:hypothetical protein